jgi:hypothetical protein
MGFLTFLVSVSLCDVIAQPVSFPLRNPRETVLQSYGVLSDPSVDAKGIYQTLRGETGSGEAEHDGLFLRHERAGQPRRSRDA